MKGLEFSYIRYGYIWNDLAINVTLPFSMSVHNKNQYGEWGRFPGSCILIKHPDVGYILYDVGDAPGPRPKYQDEFFPVEIERENYLDKQLERHGMSVNDIDAIILSHMHWDHANGMKFFTGTKAAQHVYAPRLDFLAACETAMTVDDEENSKSAYWRSTLTIPGITYTLLEEDQELFPGVHLYMFGGHTPAVMGMMLELESGNYLFPSDACGSTLNYGPPAKAPGIIYDSLGFAQTIKKLNKLEKEYNATIIYSHDRDQDKQMKVFPEFYK